MLFLTQKRSLPAYLPVVVLDQRVETVWWKGNSSWVIRRAAPVTFPMGFQNDLFQHLSPLPLFTVLPSDGQTPKSHRVTPSKSMPPDPVFSFAGGTGLLTQGESPRVKSQSGHQGCSGIPVLCPSCWQECPPEEGQYPNSKHSECCLLWPTP